MKAIVYNKYGSPEVLQLKEVEKPVPKENEVLVKVYAASINSWDWDLLRGESFIIRLWGLLKPKYKILGADIAGRVAAVGGNVKLFKPGDEVFGDLCQCGWGGFAEYVTARENALTLKPASMSFEQAAAVPQAAVMALQSLRDKKQIKPGEKILINGAGGGVGTFAVQIAKSFGAEVTGVDSTQKLDMLRSIGADHVIDYRQEDFTKNGKCYDLIIDVVASRSIFDYKRALNSKGIFVMVGGSMSALFQVLLLGSWISKTGKEAGKKMGILVHEPNKGLAFLKELFESGKVKPIIDKCYTLKEVPEAFRYFGEGHVRGKVVLTLEHNNGT